MRIQLPKMFQKIEIPSNLQVEQMSYELKLSEPDQIRYMLIVSLITNNKDEWKKRVKDPVFYQDSLFHIKKWCNMTDEEIHNLHKSLPVRM